MKISQALAVLPLLGATLAVDMVRYAPAADVDAGFGSFLEELYTSAEDPSATDTFTDFFTPTGQLIVLANVATGADAIVDLKKALLPTVGTKHWNHLPNATTIDSETAGQKTYNVFGVIETRFDGGNCSKAYYSTRFTVTKDVEAGVAQLAPHSGTLVAYDDYVVEPSESPTHIACD